MAMKKTLCLLVAVFVCLTLTSCSVPSAATVPQQTATLTPAPTPAPTLTPSPTPTPVTTLTPSPVPTATPYTSKLGVLDYYKNTTVNIGNCEVMFFKVNGVLRGFMSEDASLVNSIGVSNCHYALNGESMGTMSTVERMDTINYSFFEKRFKDEKERVGHLKVEYDGKGNISTLLKRAKSMGWKVDETKLKKLTDEMTCEELEKWIIDAVPQMLWPTSLDDYIFYKRADSLIPSDRDDEQVGKKMIRAIVVNYVDGRAKVILVEGYKDKSGKPIFSNLFDKAYVSSGDLKVFNQKLLGSLNPGVAIQLNNVRKYDILCCDLSDFIGLPFAQKLSGALTNLKPTDTIGYLRQAYEMLDDQYWYIPPKKS